MTWKRIWKRSEADIIYINSTMHYAAQLRHKCWMSIAREELNSWLISLADRPSTRPRALLISRARWREKGSLAFSRRRGHAVPRVFHISHVTCAQPIRPTQDRYHAQFAFAWRSLTLSGTNRFSCCEELIKSRNTLSTREWNFADFANFCWKFFSQNLHLW